MSFFTNPRFFLFGVFIDIQSPVKIQESMLYSRLNFSNLANLCPSSFNLISSGTSENLVKKVKSPKTSKVKDPRYLRFARNIGSLNRSKK